MKSSEEVFNETMDRLQVDSKKMAERSAKIRELRVRITELSTKFNFSNSESEKQMLQAQIKGLHRQVEMLSNN